MLIEKDVGLRERVLDDVNLIRTVARVPRYMELPEGKLPIQNSLNYLFGSDELEIGLLDIRWLELVCMDADDYASEYVTTIHKTYPTPDSFITFIFGI